MPEILDGIILYYEITGNSCSTDTTGHLRSTSDTTDMTELSSLDIYNN